MHVWGEDTFISKHTHVKCTRKCIIWQENASKVSCVCVWTKIANYSGNGMKKNTGKSHMIWKSGDWYYMTWWRFWFWLCGGFFFCPSLLYALPIQLTSMAEFTADKYYCDKKNEQKDCPRWAAWFQNWTSEGSHLFRWCCVPVMPTCQIVFTISTHALIFGPGSIQQWMRNSYVSSWEE